MSEALTFRCPLPPVECHQNSRACWPVRAKATASYRQRVLCDAVAVTGKWNDVDKLPLFDAGARLSLEFVVRDRRRRDILNFAGAFKAGVDGIVDAGLIRDDSSEHLKIGRLDMRVRERGEEPCVIVTLEATDA